MPSGWDWHDGPGGEPVKGLDRIFLAAYNIAEQNLHIWAGVAAPLASDQLTGQGVGDGAVD
jgi:hypothetical protein